MAASPLGGEDVDHAVIGDIDLDARGFNDALDDFAAGSDEFADFVGRDLGGVDARSVLRKFGARLVDGGNHGVEDFKTAFASLLESFFHDLGGDVGNLDVHLQGSDAMLGARHFEVHVAVVIFGAGDVGENRILVAFHHQAHGDTGYRSGDRHTGIHQRQGAAANAGHGTGAVRFENVAHHTQRVGEDLLIWDNGGDSAFRESTVADFATAGAAHEAHFADAEGREVVVQHEALGGFGEVEHFNALFVVFGAKGGGDQRLRFTTSEDG